MCYNSDKRYGSVQPAWKRAIGKKPPAHACPSQGIKGWSTEGEMARLRSLKGFLDAPFSGPLCNYAWCCPSVFFLIHLMASLGPSWASWATEGICLSETGGPVWVGLRVSPCVLASLRLCPGSKCLLAAPRLNRKSIEGIEGGVDWISKALLFRWGSF